jgi:hypothetical protein
MPPKKGLGGGHTGRSNGINADGSLMNVGNRALPFPLIQFSSW